MFSLFLFGFYWCYSHGGGGAASEFFRRDQVPDVCISLRHFDKGLKNKCSLLLKRTPLAQHHNEHQTSIKNVNEQN